jgi:hypothetical protein
MKNLILKIIVVVLVTISFSCTKKEVVLTAPMITTTDVNVLNDTSVTSGGNITSDGGSSITIRGIVWDISSNPTIILSTKTNDGSGIGVFNSSISSLKPATTYYIRAYATNTIGTSYGNEVIFKTKVGLPKVTTDVASLITPESATSGGNVTSDGGSSIISNGIVWSETTNPTISLKTKTINTGKLGAFINKIDSLIPDKTYYIRAYATNAIGTSYGNEVIFKTKQIVIGDKYGGGVVAYIFQVGDLGYESNTIHGIVASEVDQSQKIQWNSLPDRYDWTLTGANGTKIGTGLSNTNKIISVYNSPSGVFAAIAARNYNGGGFNDWFLPSKEELNKVYLNKLKIGGFATYTLPPDQIDDWYWTSSEINAAYAEALDFTDGHFDGIGGYKGPGGTPYKVRAIRYF